MKSRRIAVTIALLLVLTVIWVDASRGAREPAAVTAIRHEFGTGWLAGCFTAIAWRESRYNPRASNWGDVNGGSHGALQINGIWRRPGESVAAFARRMYGPRANAALAHRIYLRYGLQPWGGSCS